MWAVAGTYAREEKRRVLRKAEGADAPRVSCELPSAWQWKVDHGLTRKGMEKLHGLRIVQTDLARI
jgi:hypothetical protein